MGANQYLEIFLDEAREHLQNMNAQLLELESDPGRAGTVNAIFRAAHSLKSMAGTMGFKRMQNLTHDLENVLSEVRDGSVRAEPELIDLLFRCLDALEAYISHIRNTADEGTESCQSLLRALRDVLADRARTPQKEGSGAAGEPARGLNWKDIALDDVQIAVIEEARSQGKRLYSLNVTVQENCMLKAARAFLVFQAMAAMAADIIVSVPDARDLEDERFDTDFALVVLSDAKLEDIEAAAGNVFEIVRAVGAPVALEENESYRRSLETAKGKDSPAVRQVRAQAPQAAESAPAILKSSVAPEAERPVLNRTVRVDIESLDTLADLIGELATVRNSLVSALEREQAGHAFEEQIARLEQVTANLSEAVTKVRMVRIETVVSKFPRMVRDLAKKLGKEMELKMSGMETELDRTVAEALSDPLMHLLRNAADHGIEAPALREQAGKLPVGAIFLKACHEGDGVVIEVRDNGKGIDAEAVREKAVEKGFITPEQAARMTQKEVLGLLFLPGFSTAKKVTEVSGRGVGLDVVKEQIEAISGEVDIETAPGEGSRWIIRLPSAAVKPGADRQA